MGSSIPSALAVHYSSKGFGQEYAPIMNPGISRIAVLPPVITKRSSRLPSLFLLATISTDGAATQSGLRAEKGRCHARKRLVNRSYRKWQRKKHGGIWHGVACTRTWNTQDRAADVATARKGWEIAQQMIASKNYRMIVLDELNVVLKYEYLPLDEVLAVLNSRPDALHIVVTGRHAQERMIEAADLVTEMRLVKHPYRVQQIKAQPGIEF